MEPSTQQRLQLPSLLLDFVSQKSDVADHWTMESTTGSLEMACVALAGAQTEDWYSSFVLEQDAAMDFLSSMSSVDPDLLRIPLEDWHPTGTVWSFFGSNSESRPMAGKPEHVDQLRPGVITMHSQICGQKVWMLRPNAGAESWDKVPMLSSERIEIVCREGDQLLIDTAAWYHATNIPGGTGFTWSIAQDFSHENDEDGTVKIESVQLRISQQLCQLCLTPTTPPPGSPPGTCGCWCCGQERLKIALWRSFRLSSLLTQRFLKHNLARHGTNPVREAMRQFWQRSRLAICDEKKRIGFVLCWMSGICEHFEGLLPKPTFPCPPFGWNMSII
eukprot:s4863_g1.t1